MKPTRELLQNLELSLRERSGKEASIQAALPIGGGSINDAFEIKTNEGSLFLKTNSADRYPSIFIAEVDGLERLGSTGTLRIPTVVGLGETNDTTWLLMEFIPDGQLTDSFWHLFGKGLAQLHRTTNDQFGLDRDNYIGSLDQVNTQEKDWSAFFIQHRLEPLVKKARDQKRVEAGTAFRFERLYAKVPDLFPKEPPALLHGDLWHGNFICDTKGIPVLIDPAVYYGHREMDIAMLNLFGNIEPAFHEGYHSEWPLEKEWEKRIDLCNLYPLLVHVNLFGKEYVHQVEVILKRWV